MHAHNKSEFDTWNFLYKLGCERGTDELIVTGKSIIPFEVINDYVLGSRAGAKTIKNLVLQFVYFICGMIQLNFYLKKLGKTFELYKNVYGTGMKHEEIFAKT